jgi:hypothetical protein
VAKAKYAQYIKKGLLKEIAHYTGHSLLAHKGELNVDCSLGYHCIAKPITFDFTHCHDFPEMLCFIGGNPLDITDIGADIEVCLGEEKEKHKVTGPAVVSIPAGMMHCPITIKNVTRPFVFLEISLNRTYDVPRKKDEKKAEAGAAAPPKAQVKKAQTKVTKEKKTKSG